MKALRDLRKAKGLTLKQLGERLGVVESTISLYELGRRSPDPDMLCKLADYFGVSVDYLLGRNETSENMDTGQSYIQELFDGLTEDNKELAEAMVEGIYLRQSGQLPERSKDMEFLKKK